MSLSKHVITEATTNQNRERNADLNKVLDNTANQLRNCSAHAEAQQFQPPNSTCNSTNNATSSATSATSSAISATSQSNFKPTTNCSDMNGKYTTAQTRNIFDIHCSTDYTGFDMLGSYVYTFTDCMEACASWNSYRTQSSPQCYAVSYHTGPGSYPHSSGLGNCFFKDSGSMPALASDMADAAVFQFG